MWKVPPQKNVWAAPQFCQVHPRNALLQTSCATGRAVNHVIRAFCGNLINFISCINHDRLTFIVRLMGWSSGLGDSFLCDKCCYLSRARINRVRSERQREGWNQRKGGQAHRGCCAPTNVRIHTGDRNASCLYFWQMCLWLQFCCCWRFSATTEDTWFFSPCTQQTQERKLKMSTLRDLRSITCICRQVLFIFPPHKPYIKCIFPWKAEQKKAFLCGHYLCSISRQYLLAVRVTALAPLCFHCAPVTVHLEHTNAICILSPHRTQNNTHANSGY